MLFLVRHGRPLVDRSRPAHEWELDPAAYDDIWALRTSRRLPRHATWFSSPERKALATAELLTDGEIGVVDGLREHQRDSSEWIDDFDDAVRRAFAVPAAAAVPGWEPIVGVPRPRRPRDATAFSRPAGDDGRRRWSATAPPGRCWPPFSPGPNPTSTGGERWRCRTSSLSRSELNHRARPAHHQPWRRAQRSRARLIANITTSRMTSST